MNIPAAASPGTSSSEEKRKYWALHVDEWKKSNMGQEAGQSGSKLIIN